MKRNRRIFAIDPLRRSIEEMESVRHHGGDHFRVDATPRPGFSNTKQPCGSCHRAQHSFEVKRLDASEVDDFDFNIFLAQLFCGRESLVDHCTVGHDSEIPAEPGHSGLVVRQLSPGAHPISGDYRDTCARRK